MTAFSTLSNVYEKKIPSDIINMIMDYVITPNDKEYFALCIKTACLGMTLAMSKHNYERAYYLKIIKHKKNDERMWIMSSLREYQENDHRTHTLSYLEKVEKSTTLFGFEKLVLTKKFNKIKKEYEIKKDMGYDVCGSVLRSCKERIIYKFCGFDVLKTLENNNVDYNTQQLHAHLIKNMIRKNNMRNAINMIKFKYENLDKDIDLKEKYNYVKETAKMVVFEDFDKKQTRKKKSNIYDFYMWQYCEDTKKEEEELKYMCRKINGFADSKYTFIIINDDFDYDDEDIRFVLKKIENNAWIDNCGQTE